MVDDNDQVSRWTDERLNRLSDKVDALTLIEGDQPSDPDPTRTNITKTQRGGETVEMEWNSIHSVEITQTVKEGWRVSKVKVYDADPLAAARLGATLAMEAESELVRALNAKHAAIRERADAAAGEAEEPGQ